MAFLDNLGATITKTTSNISNKTKSVIDGSNYSNQLKVCEAKKKDLYAEIGERYYLDNVGKDIDPEMAELFNKVEESNQAIDHLKSMLRKAKGMVICPSCSAEVPSGTTFCSLCGAKIVAKQEVAPVDDSLIDCPSCGAKIKAGSAFCTSCGNKVE